jgi:hypothetical protein
MKATLRRQSGLGAPFEKHRQGRQIDMMRYARVAVSFLGFAGVCATLPAFGQTSSAAQNPPAQNPTTKSADDKSNAYYTFAMAHLYAELAGAYGNRGEYVNKAIDFYKQAMKLDPSSSYIGE